MTKLSVSLLGVVFILSSCQREISDFLPPPTDSTSTGNPLPPTTDTTTNSGPTPPTTDTTSSADSVPVTRDTVISATYGTDPLENMDVYLPANRSAKTKTIIYIHGGAWYAGDKSEANQTAIYFQKKGYGFISMNYRLTKNPTNINPAQTDDIKKVLDFISNKQTQWLISGNKICLFGASAGAHLSLLYAYKYKEDSRVKVVVSVSAPIDLTDSVMRTAVLEDYIEDFVGCKYSQNSEAYLEASPSNYLSAGCVPTIFMQGKGDETVPYLQSVSAYNILKAYGVNTKLILFEGRGHDLAAVNNEILLNMEDFMKSVYQ